MWYNPKNLHANDLPVIVVFTKDGKKYFAMTLDGQQLLEGGESDVKVWKSGHMRFREAYPDGYRGVIVERAVFPKKQNTYIETAISNCITRRRGKNVPEEWKNSFNNGQRD